MDISSKKEVSKKFNVHFFVVALAIAVGVYFALADNGKYTSKINILFLPKNDKTAVHIEEVRKNIVTIFKRTSNSELAQVKIKEGDTIVIVEASGISEEEAVGNSVATSRNIIKVASKYYSIKKDLDLRIIKEEVQRGKNNIFFVVLLSAAIGLIISFVIQFIISLVENSADRIKKNRKDASDVSRDIEDMLSKNRSKIEELSYSPKKQETSIVEKEYEENNIEDNVLIDEGGKFSDEDPIVEDVLIVKDEGGDEGVASFKKASSPQNLPIETVENEFEEGGVVPSNLPFEAIGEPEDEKLSIYKSDSDTEDKEPTEEEYRERLNQLLKGE